MSLSGLYLCAIYKKQKKRKDKRWKKNPFTNFN